MKPNKMKILTNGFLKENPVLRLVLGTCPSLAVTTLAVNALGMGAAATFVLICSNIVISALRKFIPDKVRIPAYVVIIAGFVTVCQKVVQAYLPTLDKALGIFLPLIVVNCIILGRAEMFAAKNTVVDSAIDGLGMGIGFTITLLLMGSIRELLGAGTLFGYAITKNLFDPISIFISPPGGFFVFGCLMALAVKLEALKFPKKGDKLEDVSCVGGCPGCTLAQEGGESKGGAF